MHSRRWCSGEVKSLVVAAQVSGAVLGHYLGDLTECSDSCQPHSVTQSCPARVAPLLPSCSSTASVQARLWGGPPPIWPVYTVPPRWSPCLRLYSDTGSLRAKAWAGAIRKVARLGSALGGLTRAPRGVGERDGASPPELNQPLPLSLLIPGFRIISFTARETELHTGQEACRTSRSKLL